MAQVRKRGDRKYEVIVQLGRVDGVRKQVSRTFHGSKRAADRFASRLEVEAQQGTFDRPIDLDAPPPATVAGLLEQWFAFASPVWSPSTRLQHRSIIDRHLTPKLGRMALDRVTVATVDRLYGDLRQRGLQGATVRRIHVVLHRALAQAERWGWIPANPASKATLPKVVAAEEFEPEIADVLALIVAAKAGNDDPEVKRPADPELALFIRLAAATGARRGELCGLRWADIDETSLTIARAVVDAGGGVVAVKETKTGKKRRVALDAGTVAEIQTQRARRAEQVLKTRGQMEWVFESKRRTGEPLRPNSISQRFQAVRDELGLKLRLHDLRHTNTSYLLAAGIDVRTVAGRLGHGDGGRQTLGRYGHRLDSADQRAAEVMGDYLDGQG